jgi:hypothetical protein
MNFPIKSVGDLERISYQTKWQYFEKLVAFIFEENGFDVQQNVVKKFSDTKRQFDVIAEKFDVIYLAECKKLANRQRVSSLGPAVKKHLERSELFGMMNGENVIIPVIITLKDDDIISIDDVPIVPIMKLNWFLNNSGENQ